MDEHLAIDKINDMTHEELCFTWRFAPLGHPMVLGEAGARLKERLTEMGGFTPEISKKIGWQPISNQ